MRLEYGWSFVRTDLLRCYHEEIEMVRYEANNVYGYEVQSQSVGSAFCVNI